jgi:NCS1 family nucleobase:cation symporter-1
LTTNIAANVVAPANALVNAAPRSLSFTAGGIITAVLGLLTMPWKLYDSFLNFLVAYSVLLGPVVGVVLTDYYIIRGRKLDVDALFSSSPKGAYWYQVGRGFLAWGIGLRVSGPKVEPYPGTSCR